MRRRLRVIAAVAAVDEAEADRGEEAEAEHQAKVKLGHRGPRTPNKL